MKPTSSFLPDPEPGISRGVQVAQLSKARLLLKQAAMGFYNKGRKGLAEEVFDLAGDMQKPIASKNDLLTGTILEYAEFIAKYGNEEEVTDERVKMAETFVEGIAGLCVLLFSHAKVIPTPITAPTVQTQAPAVQSVLL